MNKIEGDSKDGLYGLTNRCEKILNLTSCWFGWKLTPIKTLCITIQERHRILDVASGALLTMLVLGFIWAHLDPFGLGRTSDMYSEKIINRVMSPFYKSHGQEAIAVVLIDEDSLEDQEIGWPPTYDYYSQLLYRVMRQRPKAIFVDILLERERPSDAESLSLARHDLAEYMNEFNIPIVLAQSHPDTVNLFSNISEISSALTAWEDNDYPLLIPSGSKDNQELTWHPTVAMKLFELMSQSPLKELSQQNLVVQWGSATPSLTRDNKLLGDVDYQFVEPTMLERWYKAGALLTHSVLTGLDENSVDNNRLLSPYTLTIQAHELAIESRRGLLENKVVLIGAKVDGINDMIETPANGLLPGVYQHAMALDNLMKYGDNYYKRPPFPKYLFILIAIVLSLASSYLMVKQNIRGFKIYTLAVVVVIAACLTMYFGFHYAPQNWIGLALICALSNKFQNAS